ncbi:hypothetical protein CAL29_23800 [Bordetella genomosp. 10]|uniref:Copper transporter n=1 Tax=Bordetella genomosp. 10 TaxID=1416804 RepID=A0A261S2G2_9BORD|nr:copper chaperone PCu(A)C [Bordetella genomosp. 10]OZI30980.1 hypothetical protein CAL29_23800 [Bordetella genomosp. 10]
MKMKTLVSAALLSIAVLPLAHAADMAGMQQGSGHGIAMQPAAEATPPAGVTASDCWIRLLPAGLPAGGYLTIRNGGARTVTLTGIHADAYGMAMLHQTTTDKQNRSTMAMVQGLDIAPGQQRRFSPGGYHIMLEKPAKTVKVGDVLPISLLFKGGQSLNVQCSVRPANATKP